MDMTEFVNKSYLTAEEVKATETKIITILNKGEKVKGNFGEQVEFEVQLFGSKETKRFSPFGPSVKKMIEQKGEDSISWVGKQFPVSIETTKNNKEVVVIADLEKD